MARKKASRSDKAKRGRISDKISVLRNEGDRQDVAVAKALSMERAGRLRPGGVYVHKRGSKRRRSAGRGRS